MAYRIRMHGDLGLRSTPLSADSLGEFDALLVATARDYFKKTPPSALGPSCWRTRGTSSRPFLTVARRPRHEGVTGPLTSESCRAPTKTAGFPR
jgi:hypothetical protein